MPSICWRPKARTRDWRPKKQQNKKKCSEHKLRLNGWNGGTGVLAYCEMAMTKYVRRIWRQKYGHSLLLKDRHHIPRLLSKRHGLFGKRLSRQNSAPAGLFVSVTWRRFSWCFVLILEHRYKLTQHNMISIDAFNPQSRHRSKNLSTLMIATKIILWEIIPDILVVRYMCCVERFLILHVYKKFQSDQALLRIYKRSHVWLCSILTVCTGHTT